MPSPYDVCTWLMIPSTLKSFIYLSNGPVSFLHLEAFASASTTASKPAPRDPITDCVSAVFIP